MWTITWMFCIACAFFSAAVLYICDLLGLTTVKAFLQLLLQGSFHLRKVSLLSVRGFSLEQPERLGGVTVFEAETISTDAKLLQILTGQAFDVLVQQPCINFQGDDSGLLYIVALLQDVGWLTEARADQQPSGLQPPRERTLQRLRRRLRDRLGTPNADAPHAVTTEKRRATFEGEARVATAVVTFRDGYVDMPYELGQIIGKRVNATIAVGEANVRAVLTPEKEDAISWDRPVPSTSEAGSSGRLRYPLFVRVITENLVCELSGWRSETGFRLRCPLTCSVHFTPELAQFALSRLHPLLGCAVSLEGSDNMSATLTPLQMHIPSEVLTLRLEPLKVVLKTKAFVKALLSVINSVSKTSGLHDPHTLHAWTSAVEAEVYRSGLIVNRRMDILLGHKPQDAKGIHLAMWGSVDTANGNRVDMTLGIPAHTLQRLGVADVAPDFHYQIPVKGTAQSPDCDWIKVGKDLAELVIKSRVQQSLPFLKGLLQRRPQPSTGYAPAYQSAAATGKVPEPTLPFPWEAFKMPAKPEGDDVMVAHDPQKASTAQE